MIKTEDELDKCVKLIGGLKVSDLFSSLDFNNADYLFEKYNVVAELKCLENDKRHDPKLKNKVSEIYEKHASKGNVPILEKGVHTVSTQNMPNEFTTEVLELYRKPIRDVIKKANKQIKETKEHLSKVNAHGLLILVNDANTVLNPEHIMYFLNETFKRDSMSSINSFLFVTVNLKATHPTINKDLLVWASGDRHSDNKCPDELLSKLQAAWFKQVSMITNEAIQIIRPANQEIINEIKNI